MKGNTLSGSEVKENYYLKIVCQPGIYRLILQQIDKFLYNEYNIRLQSGQPDIY